MAEMRAAAKSSIQSDKARAAAQSSAARRSSRPSRAPEAKKQAKPAASRAPERKSEEKGKEDKVQSAQPAHAVGAAVGVATGEAATPLLSTAFATGKLPDAGAFEQLGKGVGEWWGQLSGTVESFVGQKAVSSFNELKFGAGDQVSETSDLDSADLNANELKRTKRRPIFLGEGTSVYQYVPGNKFNSEVLNFIEKIDGSEDWTKKAWLRSELALDDDASPQDVLRRLREHPKVVLHATDNVGVDGMLLARPGRQTSRVPFWDIHYADGIYEDDSNGQRSVLSRLASQYMRFNGLNVGYYVSPTKAPLLTEFFREMGLGRKSGVSGRKGQYSISKHELRTVGFSRAGLLTKNPGLSNVALYKVSVVTGSGLTPLNNYAEMRRLIKAREVGPQSRIVIQNREGVRKDGLLNQIFDGTYSLNLGVDQYPWQKNERSPEMGDYFEWLGKLGVKNYDETSFSAAMQSKSKGLKKGLTPFELRQAQVDARFTLNQVASTQTFLRNIKSSILYQRVYEEIKNSIPLLPMSLIRANPFGMPELASMLLQIRHIEALSAFTEMNPRSRPADFENSLSRPETPPQLENAPEAR